MILMALGLMWSLNNGQYGIRDIPVPQLALMQFISLPKTMIPQRNSLKVA